ncbi:hypothetical protein [Microbacterium sp. KNMS]
MAWPTVTVADVESRWRELTPEERLVAAKRIADAEAELRMELRLRGVDGTPTFATPEELADWTNLYIATVVESVKRVLVNPDGWLEEREEIDDYGRTRRRDQTVSTGLLYFSDDEIDKLVPRRRRKRGSFTIHLGQS